MAGRETPPETREGPVERRSEFDREGRFGREEGAAREGYAGGPADRERRGGFGGGGAGWVTAILAIIAAGIVAWIIAAWVSDDDQAGVGVQNATIQSILSDPSDFYGQLVTVNGVVGRVGPTMNAGATGGGTAQQGQAGQQGQQQGDQQAQQQGDQQAQQQGDQQAQQQGDQQAQQGQQAQAGSAAFVIFSAQNQEGDGVFGDNQQGLLVVDARGEPITNLQQNQLVQVTGVVREFNPNTFGQVFGDGDVFGGGFFSDFAGRPVLVAQNVDLTAGLGAAGGGGTGGGGGGGGS